MKRKVSQLGEYSKERGNIQELSSRDLRKQTHFRRCKEVEFMGKVKGDIQREKMF